MKKTEEDVSSDKTQDPVITDYNPPMQTAPKQNTLLIVILILISFFAGYLFSKSQYQEKALENAQNGAGGNDTAGTQPAGNQQLPKDVKIAKPDTKKDHWRGSASARYVWVQYSDYECPFCKRNHPDVVKLMDGNKDKMAWVFRHYPLGFHPKAQKSAEATECAAKLGGNDAFWKITDKIFEAMPDMELSDLGSIASAVGVNKTSFQKCLDSGEMEKTVTAQSNEGSTNGIAATPTAVIYDMKTGKTALVEGALPYESLKQAFDQFVSENS